MKVILCSDGAVRHDPELVPRLEDAGARVEFVECFDRCETCERRVLARLDGASVATKTARELVEMVTTLIEDKR